MKWPSCTVSDPEVLSGWKLELLARMTTFSFISSQVWQSPTLSPRSFFRSVINSLNSQNNRRSTSERKGRSSRCCLESACCWRADGPGEERKAHAPAAVPQRERQTICTHPRRAGECVRRRRLLLKAPNRKPTLTWARLRSLGSMRFAWKALTGLRAK